ncbi:MAG TPA: DUF6454 family protein [Vicinamibacterales bacterium]|nr:DUF6454 family protein [Vicinamibacterales bacterium]
MLPRVIVAILTASAVTYDGGLAERLTALTRNSHWTVAEAIPVGFDTFHPQGLVKIGDTFFVSSVDKDRRAGHLFKIDKAGNLLTDLPLTQGDMYHPGGIDYDGQDIWVPLAEYRPDSHSVIFRVNPVTMKPTEVIRINDHIGAIVHNTDDHTLHGMSWGSRRFYRWTRDGAGNMTRTLNPSHYVDYQDCKYIGARQMVCGGVTEIRPSAGAPPFRLGGLDVIDLLDGRPVHQVPVLLWTASGMSMTQNPVWLEPYGPGLRAYFMPEDNHSTLYVYDVK